MENRWWEYYAIRYFLGTVIGACSILFLTLDPDSPFFNSLTTLKEFKDATFLNVSLVAALGFAFCYIASAPILTLHAARAHLRYSVIKTSPYATSACLLLPIIISSGLCWVYLPPPAAMSVGIVVGTHFGLAARACLNKFVLIDIFYRDLATARAPSTSDSEKNTPSNEFITSYRHLREHGNAFLIVLLEIILSYALATAPNQVFSLILIVVWILPAASAWTIGSALESRLASNPFPK
ncbi:MAG: hypothetical protein AB7O49_19030 [Sphingomonadales bacterium]